MFELAPRVVPAEHRNEVVVAPWHLSATGARCRTECDPGAVKNDAKA